MQFRVLGAFEADSGRDLPIRLASTQQRTLLALLLCGRGAVVSTDALMDALWGSRQPATGRKSLHVQVHRLRRALGHGVQILQRAPGYCLPLSTHDVDAVSFEELVALARQELSLGNPVHAAELFKRGLDLWRGTPFADVSDVGPVVAERARLEEARLSALADRFEIDLSLQRHNEIIAELSGLVRAYPLREQFRRQLMIALAETGRRADALENYREGRSIMVAELGVEPGPELQEVQQQLLTNTAATSSSTRWTPLVPAQLPPDVADFTGRAGELDALRNVLRRDDSSTLRVAVITGPGGVGKSTLAVHALHEARSSYPDGQLVVNLRGTHSNPMSPRFALGRLLTSMGLDHGMIADSLEERSAHYRSALADRRILVLLDDVADEEQVRPLLPGTETCAVVVTSRARLTGLDRTTTINLEELEPHQAISLLATIAGADRVNADIEMATEIVTLCGHLPLAVRIAASRLNVSPHWTPAVLLGRLRDERQRLDTLAAGDLAVRSSIGLSYRGLNAAARHAFNLLGLAPMHEITGWMMAALTDTPLREAEIYLETLEQAQLLSVVRIDEFDRARYRWHDLVRLYAAERAEADCTPEEREIAIDRLLQVCLSLTETATRLAYRWVPGGVPRAEDSLLDERDVDDLLAQPERWLLAERANLVSAIHCAYLTKRDALTWRLAETLQHFFERHSQHDDWRTTYEWALAAASRTGSVQGQTTILTGLAELHLIRDQYDDCLARCAQARSLLPETGEDRVRARILRISGISHQMRADHSAAIEDYEEALAIFATLDDRAGLADILYSLGIVRREQGQFDEALRCHRQALALYESHGDDMNCVLVYCAIGIVHAARGDLPDAERYLRQSLGLATQCGFRPGIAYALGHLGDLLRQQQRNAEARQSLDTALEMSKAIDDTFAEALALRGIGRLSLAEEDFRQARESLTHAQHIWRELGLDLWLARTTVDLGDLHFAEGEPDTAARLWTMAREIFGRIGSPEVSTVGRPGEHKVCS